MIFSLTPFRLRSIMRSGDKSKRLERDSMTAMMVFSLKFAFTNLTTAALVSGASFPDCADATCGGIRQNKKSETIKALMGCSPEARDECRWRFASFPHLFLRCLFCIADLFA